MAEENAVGGTDDAGAPFDDPLVDQPELDDRPANTDASAGENAADVPRLRGHPYQAEQIAGTDEQLHDIEDGFAKSFRMPDLAGMVGADFAKSFRMPDLAGMVGADFAKSFRMPDLAGMVGADFAKSFRMPELAGMVGAEFGSSFRMPSLVEILGIDFARWNAAFKESLRRSQLPSNLRDLPLVTSEELLNFTLEHGISLYLVPRASVAQRFIQACDSASARRLLGDCRREIVSDCKLILEDCDQLATLGLRQMALQVVAALDADLYAPAQALAGNLLDSLLHTHLDPNLARVAKRKQGETLQDIKSRLDALEAWEAYVVCALWSTFRHYFESRGDAVPHAFSRHATAHAVGRRQYSRRSAVQGLMAVTSAIGYINGLS